MQRASSLEDNVTESLKERLQAKMAKRYGPNTALVIRDTSGVDWNWDVMVGDLKTSFSDQLNPFDRGIWLLNRSKDGFFSFFEPCQTRWRLTRRLSRRRDSVIYNSTFPIAAQRHGVSRTR